MDFTREPIIETIITPKEGCKLVVRNSKASGQEEYFIDALEVVSFGNSFFYRSLERPKSFLLPVTDYEVLEVRETRMILKHVGIDKNIKIGGGKDSLKSSRGRSLDRKEGEQPAEKKRERKRTRRRRGREDEKEDNTVEVPIETAEAEASATSENVETDKKTTLSKRKGRSSASSKKTAKVEDVEEGSEVDKSGDLSALLPPPTTLISETIGRYKEMQESGSVAEVTEGKEEPLPAEPPKKRRRRTSTKKQEKEATEAVTNSSDLLLVEVPPTEVVEPSSNEQFSVLNKEESTDSSPKTEEKKERTLTSWLFPFSSSDEESKKPVEDKPSETSAPALLPDVESSASEASSDKLSTTEGSEEKSE